jgi:hypothetical protein
VMLVIGFALLPSCHVVSLLPSFGNYGAQTRPWNRAKCSIERH